MDMERRLPSTPLTSTERTPAMVKEHPVATTTATTTSIAALVVWLLGRYGVAIGAEDGVLIAGALGTLVARVGGPALKRLASTHK
jgi:hypothetical protein